MSLGLPQCSKYLWLVNKTYFNSYLILPLSEVFWNPLKPKGPFSENLAYFKEMWIFSKTANSVIKIRMEEFEKKIVMPVNMK